MTRQICLSFIFFACCSVEAEASEDKFIYGDQRNVTKLCIAAAKDDLDGVRRAIRSLRRGPHHKYKTIVNSVRCNGQVAAQFAQGYNATETFEYLFKFTEKKYKKMLPVNNIEAVAASATDAGGPGIVNTHVTGK